MTVITDSPSHVDFSLAQTIARPLVSSLWGFVATGSSWTSNTTLVNPTVFDYTLLLRYHSLAKLANLFMVDLFKLDPVFANTFLDFNFFALLFSLFSLSSHFLFFSVAPVVAVVASGFSASSFSSVSLLSCLLAFSVHTCWTEWYFLCRCEIEQFIQFYGLAFAISRERLLLLVTQWGAVYTTIIKVPICHFQLFTDFSNLSLVPPPWYYMNAYFIMIFGLPIYE